MIDVSGLRKVYRDRGREVVALGGVDLRVREGEIFGVLGQSGAGKSTLLRCVNLLERPTEGTVSVAGQELTALREGELRRARQRIGMIHQHFALLSSRTVAGNVAFPLEVMGVGRAERARRVAELLELVGLADKAGAHPAQLSGGQKQRVGIARALAGNPSVLLSDEATSALDPATTQSILSLLRNLNRELGLTILLITHEMHVVKGICDSVAVMRDGLVEESGAIPELIARPGSRLAAELFPLPRPEAGNVTITFTGQADEPVVSEIVRKFDVDVNILGGALEEVAGVSAGRLRVRLTGGEREAALDYLTERGLLVEVTP
ncbi:ATP-binding cassette domain-containing protein [Planomonospora sp. ID91781]|uniref:Methionine ABC transporter ATP-binding protein n=1 Tax=Planomonospora sphaerica TaxID=161355 RepID=A0A171B1M1_9ACTN|nr:MULTISPECIES: ATP-binding cassette domain-containing protein [Planomonospora]MBG0822306.1 ATP-binding cassette domain-containing protein [Planomonospora sp. ID91781]GAT64562.1 methionine ABC transporter ATP-binding protein [Planomonospora sphaerica]GGL24964.1 methionine import ATP-binding protein MetN [Planomonospora parontospora subsp. antibiotica]GII16389.1 methionine import ATP-binding protein MetN [Planomonospora parontospora subsp. antibiotica]